jgi:hypothetical protein
VPSHCLTNHLCMCVFLCRVVTPASGTCQVLAAMWLHSRVAATAGQHLQQAGAASCREDSHTQERMDQVGPVALGLWVDHIVGNFSTALQTNLAEG